MRYFYLTLVFILNTYLYTAQLVIANQGGSATAVVTAMVGGGLTVSNATINCPSNAYGTFTNGASTNLGIPSGIVLTTGNVNTLNGTGGTFWSADNGTTCNDAQLGSLEPLADYDCCILEFDVVPSCTTLRIRFVFGSEEYPEWVSAGYNDAFGFFVTGQNPGGGNYNNTNVATLPNNTTIVSIDNVNANTNSAYYVNNSAGTSSVLDAFTTVLTRDVAVTPCQTYHFKLAIADAGDPIFDSGVFIDFLDCVNSVTTTTSTTPASCAGNDGTATANVSAGYPPYTYSWNTTPTQTSATATGLTPGTYTVTIDDAGACTPPIVQTVTVGAGGTATTPIFTQVAPICSGGNFTLPTTSTNGITGTWSPVINTTTSTTYTFTPTAGQCANNTTMSVSVNPQITPTFTQVPTICSGGTFTLPTTSSNSITGTWSPAINNTATTTYTFTPDAGQCANTTTMSVTVNPQTTPTFTQVAPICTGAPFTLPTTSTNGLTGTWSPAINNTTTTAYTFTPSTGQCATTAFMTVNVGSPQTPSFPVTGPYCEGENFSLPTTSLEGFTGTWSPLVNFTSTTTYTFTPTTDQCANQVTMTVGIVSPIIPTFNQWGPYCQNDILLQVILPETSNEGVSGTWNPAMASTSISGDIIHTFTPNSGECATNSTMTINIAAQTIPTFNQLGPFCQGELATSFTNTSIEGIIGVWGPPGINTGISGSNTYTFVPNSGQCASSQTMTIQVNSPSTPQFSEIPPICSGEGFSLPNSSINGILGVWSPAINNLTSTSYTFTPSSNQCATIATMSIIVNPLPTISAGNPQSVCVGDQVTLEGSGAGSSGSYTWTNGVIDGQAFPVNSTMTYTVTGTDANGCSGSATVVVTGLPLPLAQFTASPTEGTVPLTVDFINTSQNATNFVWDFGNGLGAVAQDLSSQLTIYETMGVYTVWLIASNGLCADSMSVVITVEAEPWIFVPNVFTPNEDGENEIWMVQTKNMETIDLIILNRWGNVMTKITDLAGGWDGKTDNGSDATDGTYFYKYKAKALNGDEFSGHGFLTLIR